MAGSSADITLNTGDVVDGGAGTDTLNLTMNGTAVPVGIEVKNVEIVNLDVTGATAGAGFLKSSLYTGVTQLWQVNKGGQITAASSGATQDIESTYSDVVVGDGVTAGFKGNAQVGAAGAVVDFVKFANSASDQTYTGQGTVDAVKVTAASATQKAISIALDGVGTGSSLDVVAAASGKIETVNVSGSLAKASSTVDASLAVDLDASNTKTFKGDFTSGVKLALTSTAVLETVNLAGSTGGVELDVSNTTNFAKIATVTGGSGAEKLTVAAAAAVDLTVSLGAGADTLTIAGSAATNGGQTNGGTKETTVTLGEGKDTVKLSGAFVSNIADVDAIETNGLITIGDFKVGEDALTFAGNAYQGLVSGAIDKTSAGSLKAAATSALVADKATVFQYGADAYVVVDANGSDAFDNGDGLIKLTGVSATDLVGSATSFVLIS